MVMSSAHAFELCFFFLFNEQSVYERPLPSPLGGCKVAVVPSKRGALGTVALWWQRRGASAVLAHPRLAAGRLVSRPFLVIALSTEDPTSISVQIRHTGTLHHTDLFMTNGNEHDPAHKLADEHEALSGSPLRLHRKC